MKFADYYQVREWLESFIPQVWGRQELGLERIRYLLALLGNPERKFKSIHIAGTSGKGSTAFYVARLSESLNFSRNHLSKTQGSTSKNLKIGLHVSPHLVDIRERMQILQNQKSKSKYQKFHEGLMPVKKFLRLFNEIKPIVEKIQIEKPDLTPSYFEILVAATFLYFAKVQVDWAVIEVGLGGRLDATNVLAPEVSVITNIGLDHTEILGKTIEKIAYEKAGIIKRGVPVVTGALRLRSGSTISHKSSKSSSGKALEVIEKVAREKKAPLIKVDTQLRIRSPKSDTKGNFFNYYDILRHTPGNFVFSNALLAIEVVRQLGFQPSKEVITKAISSSLPGRLEEIDDPTSPLRLRSGLRGASGVILDGAHNPQKIKFLINFLRKLTVDSSQFTVILVLAFKKGKDWKRMVDLLIKNLLVKRVIATKFYAVTDTGPTPSRLRGVNKFATVEPKEIAQYVRSVYGLPTTVYSNSQEAVFEAMQSTVNSQQSTVLVTGSLYLVGEVRTMWHLPGI